MESTAQAPLDEVVIRSQTDEQYFDRVRLEVFARNEYKEELEQLLPQAEGQPLRKATVQDLLGDRSGALATLGASLDDSICLKLYGRFLLEQGRASDAREHLEKAWGQNSADPKLGALLVEARAMCGDTEPARELAGSLSLPPESGETEYLEGLIREQEGNYQDAIEFFEKAAETRPEDTRFHFRLGYLHALHGDEERAIRAYEMCQRATPVYAAALINLGTLYEDEERFEDAVTCYRMVLSSNPDHRRARLYLEDAEASLNMYYDREKEKEKSRRNQILQIPVTDFELSVRSRTCLAKMNIHTLGDLIKKTEAELLSYKNFGETSLAEIKKILAQKGFRLGQGIEDKPTPRQLPDSEQAKILAEPVSVLDLSSRAQRCMDRLGIESLGDLVKRTELELISQKNFGMTSLNELKTKLKERGLSLASG